MSNNRSDREKNSREYQTFDRKPDIMDRIGESFSSVFSRRSRRNDKADQALVEISKKGNDDYELFVDEIAEQKQEEKLLKLYKKSEKKNKIPKPVTPFARRVKNIITYCTIVAVVLIVCVVLSLTVLFKTQAYDVSGNTKYTQQELVNTCGITLNENIFLANKKAASQRLVSTYAYIEEAKVSFAIPDTITIEIKEAVPAYLVKVTDGEYLVASAKGRILEKTDSADKYDLPLFMGNNLKSNVVGGYIAYESETTLNIINEIVTVFADNGYKGITEIDATDTGDVSFTYDDRIKVKIGVPEDISYKVRTAMTIITEKLDLNGSKTTEGELDVSSCNTTKKSYFREQSLIENDIPVTKPEDEYTDEEETQDETKPALSPEDWYI